MKNISFAFLSFMLLSFQLKAQIDTSYKWTWIGGSPGYNATGVYGQKGVENATNQPGGRFDFASWTDLNGNLWMFGGYGRAASTTPGWLNDLWRFNTNNNQWTWMSGDSVINQPAFQSGLGVSSSNNKPSARSATTYWTSGDDRELYLYGGASNIDGGDDEVNGDVWAYNVVTGMWRIIKYAIVNSSGQCTGQAAAGPDEFSAGVWPLCRLGATASNVGGKAFVFGGCNGNYGQNLNSEFFMFSDYNSYQPQNNQWASIQFGAAYTNNQPGYYSGSFLRPGSRRDAGSFAVTGIQDKFFVFGGVGHAAFVNGVSTQGELNDLWRYDGRNPLTSQPIWTWLKGDSTLRSKGNYGTKGVASVSNTPGARRRSVMKSMNASQAVMFGGAGHVTSGFGVLNDLWSYDVGSNMWTWISGSSIPGGGGSYGIKGRQSRTNLIPAREGAVMWVSNGNVYIFGGCCDFKNDMWKFSPQEEPTPVNNTPCTATTLVLDAAPQYGSNQFATNPNGISNPCYQSTNPVWFQYTPSASGYVQFTLGPGLSGDTLNSWVNVFTSSGSCPSTLQLADSTATTFGGCRNYFAPSNRNPTIWSSYLTAGKTYYFQLSGLLGDVGRYSFSIQSTAFLSTTSGRWHNPGIWNTNRVPNTESRVTITSSVVIDSAAICHSLTVENGATVTVQSGKLLTVLNGNVPPGAALDFDGVNDYVRE